jgi:hypothetical protein
MEGKTWVLSTGTYGDRLYLSIRTSNPRANAGNLIRKLIGRRGKGGGHGTMAGGFLDLPENVADGGRALERQLAQRFARALEKNPDRLLPIALSRPEAERREIPENGNGGVA